LFYDIRKGLLDFERAQFKLPISSGISPIGSIGPADLQNIVKLNISGFAKRPLVVVRILFIQGLNLVVRAIDKTTHQWMDYPSKYLNFG
jgi:hypothetical protein